jgi:glycerol-3-phosphate dehydrogenase
MYYDAVMKDKDIVITVANKARHLGAEIFSEEKVVKTINTTDYVTVNTNKRAIQCKVLVNVTGAWNKEHTSPSKGVHLITNKLKSEAATILINPDDGRAFFTIPYNNTTIIGTTDEPYSGDPDDVRVTMTEKQYILKAINNFCIQNISSDNIIGEYAGLRPLAKDVTKHGSRDTSIHSSGRIISMVGGKFTTHRAMSEELIKIVARTI